MRDELSEMINELLYIMNVRRMRKECMKDEEQVYKGQRMRDEGTSHPMSSI